jgi:hypothetical protein
MTQDEIIEMAREAGLIHILDEHAHEYGSGTFENTPYPELEAFAKLVGAKEREACKALAKEYAAEYKEGGRLYPMLNGGITKTVASACDHVVYIIGERGQA